MTITEANAANDVARCLIRLAAEGAHITPTLECASAQLLTNANKALSAGYTTQSFLEDLAAARRNAKGEHAR